MTITSASRSASLGIGVLLLTIAGSAQAAPRPLINSLSLTRLAASFQALRTDPAVRSFLADSNHQMIFQTEVASDDFQTFKFQSFYKGVEVLGAMALHHVGVNSEEISHSLTQFDLDVIPTLTEEQAFSVAQGIHPQLVLEQRPELKVLPSDEDESARLVYWMRLKGDALNPGYDVVVDGHSGDVLANVTHHLPIAQVEVYTALNGPAEDVDTRSGAPIKFELPKLDHVVNKSEATSSADESALRAASNAKRTLTYYLNRHARNSFDNKGSATVSIVHAGRGFANAFWSSGENIMAYGDGDGTRTQDFTLGIDVAGHELTHGVVQETANLIYFGESGALNEAFADFFGKMIEGKNNWIVGGDLFVKAEDKLKGIRNIANPGTLTTYYQDDQGNVSKKPYPTKLSEKFNAKGTCDGSNDFCFVHVNSTIASHAAYQVYQAIGADNAQKLMYAVLTHYLTPRSGFKALKTSLIKACGMTLDTASCTKVQNELKTLGF